MDNVCCVCNKTITECWYHGQGMVCSDECKNLLTMARQIQEDSEYRKGHGGVSLRRALLYVKKCRDMANQKITKFL